jgi:hypothetical protein
MRESDTALVGWKRKRNSTLDGENILRRCFSGVAARKPAFRKKGPPDLAHLNGLLRLNPPKQAKDGNGCTSDQTLEYSLGLFTTLTATAATRRTGIERIFCR